METICNQGRKEGADDDEIQACNAPRGVTAKG